MEKIDFFVPFEDKIDLHCICWIPSGAPCGILQIVHGMMDYADRYDKLGTFLAERGFLVVAHDQIGHGLTAKDASELGYIPKKGGAELLVECAHSVTAEIKLGFPDIPNFILGHSMGSFVTRRFLTKYGNEVCGAVIMGTGNQSPIVLGAGKLMATLIGKFKGEGHRSEFLDRLIFSPYNKHCHKIEGKNAWICSDREFMKIHDEDPLATFVFTASGFWVLFDLLMYLAKGKNFNNIPKALSVLIMSGSDDAVGAYGKAPKYFANQCKNAGIRDVDLRLYEGDRHEIINEPDGDKVMEDLYVWLKAHMSAI